MRTFFPAFVLWVLAAGWLAGQSLSKEEVLSDPPPTGLSDADGVLGRDSDARRRVAGLIGGLERKRGYRLFVVLERSLMSSNPSDLAARLQQAWLPEGAGLSLFMKATRGN